MNTHSLVALTFSQLGPHEYPPELTFNGQQALLLRRVIDGSIADLTLDEARNLITENTQEEML